MKIGRCSIVFIAILILLQCGHEVRAELPVRFEQKLGASLPKDVLFRGEDGKSVALGELLDGKPVILNLVYFGCPNLCTWVLNGLVKSMKELPLTLGTQYKVITISINPKEQPSLALAKKRSYLARYGISEVHHPDQAQGWRFLTESKLPSTVLLRRLGFIISTTLLRASTRIRAGSSLFLLKEK